MQFEWDESKNLANVEKHGVSFEEAVYAFLDPDRKIRFNPKHSQEEKRYFCFGKVGKLVLTVRFTVRGETIRIIGAGYWREGRKVYEQD
ncbi:MAG: BrnT family toxin [Dehalococcoidia bacterium]